MEYFCAAKPQNCDLQTVQPRSGVLLRFVIELLKKPKRSVLSEPENPDKMLKLIFTENSLSGNGKEATRLEFQFHQPIKPLFPLTLLF